MSTCAPHRQCHGLLAVQPECVKCRRPQQQPNVQLHHVAVRGERDGRAARGPDQPQHHEAKDPRTDAVPVQHGHREPAHRSRYPEHRRQQQTEPIFPQWQPRVPRAPEQIQAYADAECNHCRRDPEKCAVLPAKRHHRCEQNEQHRIHADANQRPGDQILIRAALHLRPDRRVNRRAALPVPCHSCPVREYRHRCR